MSTKLEAAYETLDVALDVIRTCGVTYSGHFRTESTTKHGEEIVSICYYYPWGVLADRRVIEDDDAMLDIVQELLDSFRHEGYKFGNLL